MKKMKKALFGTAGNPERFYDEGFKASVDLPKWLEEKGLDVYEYSAGRGVRIKEETANAIGEQAKIYGIKLSLHAPYFINLATVDEEQKLKNFDYILSAVKAAEQLGADRVVLHAGGQGKVERQAAFEQTKKGLSEVVDKLTAMGLKKVKLLPETMGKKGQIGTLEEVLQLCQLEPGFLMPTVDFGHLHAVTQGTYIQKHEYKASFDLIGEQLGKEILQELHVHFSRIEFTKAGEKRHWTFADDYGPPFEPFIDAVVEYGLTPRVICESAGTQDIDALQMKDYYLSKL